VDGLYYCIYTAVQSGQNPCDGWRRRLYFAQIAASPAVF
jgi:hypothetical protein